MRQTPSRGTTTTGRRVAVQIARRAGVIDRDAHGHATFRLKTLVLLRPPVLRAIQAFGEITVGLGTAWSSLVCSGWALLCQTERPSWLTCVKTLRTTVTQAAGSASGGGVGPTRRSMSRLRILL